MQDQAKQIKEFILGRIQNIDYEHTLATDVLKKLELSAMRVSFSHILTEYLGQPNTAHLRESQIKLVYDYLEAQCFAEALIQARLARKNLENWIELQFNDQSYEKGKVAMEEKAELQKLNLLIVECMLKQGKFEDSYDMLETIEISNISQDNLQQFYDLESEILLNLKNQQKTEESLIKLEQIVKERFGDQSIQYGFFYIKRGRSFGDFGNYQRAVENMSKGMEIMIECKCKEKKKIADIYLSIASYQRMLKDFKKQYTSLICALSMVKQLANSDKQAIPIIHLLATNLLEREEYEKALNELIKAKNLEKQIYGQSSIQMGKTSKHIANILKLLNRKTEARKYEQEYSRILGEPKEAKVLNSRIVN